MPSPTSNSSLRSRLLLVAALAMVLGLLPSIWLLRGMQTQIGQLKLEAQGLPVNRLWQASMTAMQKHQSLAAESVSTRLAAKDELPAAAHARDEALKVLQAELPPQFDARHAQAIQALSQQIASLDQALNTPGINVAHLMRERQAIEVKAVDAITDFNDDAGLLHDPDRASYFGFMAGLQSAPLVNAALAELSTIATAAAVDDVDAVASAVTRYHERADAMLRALLAAQRADHARDKALAPMIEQARQQRELVDTALRAAAHDVNYPLPVLAASFAKAAQLQSQLSAQLLHFLESELQHRAQVATVQGVLLLGGVVGLLSLLGGVLYRSMKQLLTAIGQILQVTDRIASGDLTQPVPEGRRDEIGGVLTAMKNMQDRLRELVEQIHQGAGSIRTAAEEISGGNLDLAQRTEMAASHLQQTTSNVDLLDQSVQQSAQARASAAALTDSASDMANSGDSVVGQVVETMRGIQDASRQIADITGLIDGIAFQTNILALNAAVEAARAGEQGRGFAVVASEVRALAGRSTTAVREIRSLIARSVERVESGAVLAADAGQAMQQIVSKVHEVSTVVRGMDQQARTQASQTEELSRAVRAIDAMTQQNAALVEQSAASADTLRLQATAMETAVQAFRL
ncbi:methyl-accepting chemotaxis protein [Roseateles koreensis]|uniref:Methyl-accepting chemotaxis protein n=1 Tax=Roseateles koreensis TaxID=2987526 RepID=A0ABT5KTK1_9BURK|nr:methyl-accepting chemotaxis protein [Roseateles koreensis]MDC8786254.1 methyl-accepting chemotaxis protein [Roseateles koreensis]